MHTPVQICISQGIQRIVDTRQAACKPLIMIQETPNDTDAELEAWQLYLGHMKRQMTHNSFGFLYTKESKCTCDITHI